MRIVDVYYNNHHAGELREISPGQKYEFEYDEDYLSSDLPHISLTLPKRRESYVAPHLFPFFVNILPEGYNKEIICRRFRIDEEDDFSLLHSLADADFIGAIEIRSHYD